MLNKKNCTIMKKMSKKEFKSLLKSVACALITCTSHKLINEQWTAAVWQDIAKTALLDYPQTGIIGWQVRYNYLTDLCKTIKQKNQ